MLERIHRCPNCHRELDQSGRWAVREGRVCSDCQCEALEAAAKAEGPIKWDRIGHYLVPRRTLPR